MGRRWEGPAPSHWIRQNHQTRVARRHIFLDSEAKRSDNGEVETQTFRLAVACLSVQHRKGENHRPDIWGEFTSPERLWRWVDDQTVKGRTTVLWAHNLAYDLRVTEAFRWLPLLGWELEFITLNGGHCSAQWRRDGRPLRMADSSSWFPTTLEHVGKLVGIGKPELPSDDDSRDAWMHRCRQDVEILRAAVLRAFDWIERDDMGNWKPTGAGQGWAAFRHKWMTHKILHHGIEEVANVEREAAWSGRCEAWRHGDLGIGPWHEVDFTSAYASVALDVDVPVRLLGRTSASEAKRCLAGREGFAALVRCDIRTEVPSVPARGPRGIVWPVGTFTSWLWDVEAAEVLADGGDVTITGAWLYRTAPALREWASWIFDRLDEPPEVFDPLLRLIVKGWSRSLIGRFGSRWPSWEEFGDACGPDVSLSTMIDGSRGGSTRLLSVGGRSMIESEASDAPDGAVHVMSYVMAVARCRLLAAMRVVGPEHFAYVDTDGLLVDGEGLRRLDAAQLPGLRLKASWGHVEVLGPRQLILDGKLKAAGVPSSALRTPDGGWEGRVWRSLATSLSQGELDRVTITDRTWQLRGVDHRRLHVEGGRTAPVRFPLPA